LKPAAGQKKAPKKNGARQWMEMKGMSSG